MNNIAIVYHYIAHYRMPIFSELAKDSDINYDFISGLTPDQNIKIAKEEELTSKLLKWHKVKNLWFFHNKLLWQKGLLSILIKNKYESVIFLGNPYFISTWIAMLMCKILKTEVCLWTHGVTDELGGFKLLLSKLFWVLSNKIFLYGNYAKSKMQQHGVDSNKLIVIYNSLDYTKQLEVRAKLKRSHIYESYFKNNDPVIIFTGRLTKVKKLTQLILSHNILLEEGVFCNIIFVGSGSEANALRVLVDKLGLSSRYWFYGECYSETQIGEFFFNAKVCIAPGNVGLTAIHSMVYGTPVISHSNFANQMPEFEAIKKGITGDFFEEDKIDDLAEKASIWLHKDITESNQIRLACYDIIANYYNPEYQTMKFNEIFR